MWNKKDEIRERADRKEMAASRPITTQSIGVI